MPYYIYKVFDFPMKRLEKIEQHDNYKQAADRSKVLRKELAITEQCNVKMMFAENELQAEELLLTVREPAPELGDD
jgi:NADH:ubiquinone oxidoreductase subunit D